MAIANDTILNVVRNIYPDFETYEHRNQLSIIVPKDKIVEVAFELKENPETSFEQLLDVTAIDWLDKKQTRFEIVYNLYSLKYASRLRLKVPVSEKDCNSPSLVSIWESADWYERETYDMYGITFEKHPDMRRFYMPEDYKDPSSGEPIYPLRKDFPLMGVPDSLSLPPYPEKYGPTL